MSRTATASAEDGDPRYGRRASASWQSSAYIETGLRGVIHKYLPFFLHWENRTTTRGGGHGVVGRSSSCSCSSTRVVKIGRFHVVVEG